MTTNSIWYAGRCVKRLDHDLAVILDVTAKFDDAQSEWTPVENPQRLLPKMGEVELRSSGAKSLRVGEWVAFQLSGKGKHFWLAGTNRRLFRYADLTHLGSIDRIQRLLLGDGLPTIEPSGSWMVRARDNEVIQVELRQVNGSAHLIPSSAKVSAFEFKSDRVIAMPLGGGSVSLYDLATDSVIENVYDWSPDEAFILRVVRAVADTNDPRVRQVISFLEAHSSKSAGLMTFSGAHLAAASDELRSGKLAKRLAEDATLLQTFVDALLSDSKVSSLIAAKAESIAEKERHEIRRRTSAELDEELKKSRRHQLQALENEIQSLASRRHKDLDDEAANRKKEIERNLSSLAAKGAAELEKGLQAQKSTLESEIATLHRQGHAIKLHISSLQADLENTRASVAAIQQEETQARESLRSALELLRSAENAPRADSAKNFVPVQRHNVQVRLAVSDVKQCIQDLSILSARGKTLMWQFVALLLAGEVPVLCGPEVEDFLEVAKYLVAGGVVAYLEGDPTIITFEDLWLRAGTGIPTPLAQALAIANSENPTTMLAIVRRAENSGARFWHPALADRARRGELPRRLLLCATVQDENAEEARFMFEDAVRLEIQSAFTDSPSMAAVALLSTSPARSVEPGERPDSCIQGMGAIAPLSKNLSIVRALRAARAATEAQRLSKHNEQPAALLSITSLFAAAPVAQMRLGSNEPRGESHA